MSEDASFSASKDDLIERVMPALEDVESQRLTFVAEFNGRKTPMYIGIALGALLGLLGIVVLSHTAGAIVGLAIGLGVWHWAHEPERKYRAEYKNALLPKIAERLGQFEYSLTGGIHMSTIKPSGIVPGHDRYTYEDYFKGTYNTVRIEFCEARLAVRRRSRRRTYYQTIFNGLMIRLDMPKPFDGRTVVRKDAGVFNWMQRLGPLESIRLEDPEFEKLFEVHGNDQVEARRLLTPAFMERLKGLEESVGGKSIECAFYDNRLFIMMPHDGAMKARGLLEPGPLNQPARNQAIVEKIADELSRICGIVDELKLAEQQRRATPTTSQA